MEANSRPTTARSVSPEILRIAGDVARPSAPVPASRDLGHLPGKRGLLAGIAMVAGLMREGEAYLQRLVERYGLVFRHQLGPDPIVLVADPDLIWTILRNEDGAWSASLAFFNIFGGLDTSGPLVLDFEKHKEVRRLLQPAFGAPAVASYLTAAEEI
jgi:cytochrome P450